LLILFWQQHASLQRWASFAYIVVTSCFLNRGGHIFLILFCSSCFLNCGGHPLLLLFWQQHASLQRWASFAYIVVTSCFLTAVGILLLSIVLASCFLNSGGHPLLILFWHHASLTAVGILCLYCFGSSMLLYQRWASFAYIVVTSCFLNCGGHPLLILFWHHASLTAVGILCLYCFGIMLL
jgi:hypothetical protein